MLLSRDELFNLRVVTRRGIFLGHVENIVYDTDSQSIFQYSIRLDWRFLKTIPFLQKKYILIHRRQVITIDVKEMIVEDAVVPVEDKGILKKQLPKVAEA